MRDTSFDISHFLRYDMSRKGERQYVKSKDKTKGQLIKELDALKRQIDKLKKHERELRKAKNNIQREFIEYETLSALGRLTANISHEIRNPITVIGGLAKRLQMNSALPPEKKEDLKVITWEAKKLESILRNVLFFSGKTVLHRQENNIHEMLGEQLKTFAAVCREHSIKIHRYFRAVPQIYIDKKQFHEAVRNIISNAIDAMSDGGSLSVTTRKGLSNGKHYVVVEISDTGEGIPDESISMIFEPFFSTKVAKKETGLGLSITKKIVEGHGGFIKAESKVGKGSTFGLYFPYRFIETAKKMQKKEKRL